MPTFLVERKQAKSQRVQDPGQRNVDNLNNGDVKLADISGTNEGLSENQN